MQQVKIFKALEHQLNVMEEGINQWLAESGARVLQITGNVAPQSPLPEGEDAPMRKHPYPCSDVVVIVLYEVPGK